jgi:hypothetical protein
MRESAGTSFSAEWLALREPADTRARDVKLTARLAEWARSRGPVRFIDLACGTGANRRYLAPRAGGDAHWLLVDGDAGLLERAGSVADGQDDGCSVVRASVGSGGRIETRQLDLVTDLHALDFAPDTVITASALLDLVSDRWLVQLVERCGASRCASLFALSYDGRIAFTPVDADDEWVRELVNRHQLGEKGFGPASGPGAWRRACELFREAGYDVQAAQSDWNLVPAERQLQQALLEGWAGAAMELASNEADRCRRWLTCRLAHVANEASRITVGHQDVLALPPDQE